MNILEANHGDIELIGKLKRLGFTENEAKIYVGLLSFNEATAR